MIDEITFAGMENKKNQKAEKNLGGESGEENPEIAEKELFNPENFSK